MQAAADIAIGETLAGAPPNLGMSLVSVEPTTGYVRALYGGRISLSVGLVSAVLLVLIGTTVGALAGRTPAVRA